MKQDKQTAFEMLEDIKNYLEDNYASDKLIKSCEFIENFITELVCDYEFSTSLAEQEYNPRFKKEEIIIEKIRHDED